MSAVGACARAGDRSESQNWLRARCEMNGSGRDCRIVNLTASGVFVESYVPAVTGSRVTMSFRLPNGHQVRTPGVVSDHRFQLGFSVEFVELSAHDRDHINSIAV